MAENRIPETSSHLPALDGVRGLAVLLVLMYDCLKLPADGMPWTFLLRKVSASGWLGVDLFFVLSGFLITGILLDTRGSAGYWKSFLIRRAVRIFPLYYLTLLIVFVIAPLTAGAFGSTELLRTLDRAAGDQWWYWSYLQNWLIAGRQAWPADRLLNHFWSLAIEEQFYLIWPFIVAVLCRRGLARFCILACSLALGLRFYLLLNGLPGVCTYVMTITRMDSLCMGALVAIVLREQAWRQRWLSIAPWLTAGLFLATLGIDAVWGITRSESFGAYTIGHTWMGLCFATLIGLIAILPAGNLLPRVFSIRPLMILGKYSYAIYICHRFSYSVVQSWGSIHHDTSSGAWVTFLSTVALSLGIAVLTWKFIEEPCLSLKRFAPRPVPNSAGGEERFQVRLIPGVTMELPS